MHKIGATGFLLALIASGPVRAEPVAEAAVDRLRAMILADGCSDASDRGEIVVCGRRTVDDKYRLPLPTEPAVGGGPVQGEVPNASPDRLASGSCGIFKGDRRCSKAESLLDGYGGGRNPLNVIMKLMTLFGDPDADMTPPPPLPKRVDRSR